MEMTDNHWQLQPDLERKLWEFISAKFRIFFKVMNS